MKISFMVNVNLKYPPFCKKKKMYMLVSNKNPDIESYRHRRKQQIRKLGVHLCEVPIVNQIIQRQKEKLWSNYVYLKEETEIDM